MTEQAIPAQAVEAATDAMQQFALNLDRSDEHTWAKYARLALEAAAPCARAIITTAEELDALPVGAVVHSNEVRHRDGGWTISYQRWQDGGWHRGARSGSTHPDNFLPVTVLHVSGAL